MLLASLILQKPWQRRTEHGEEEEYNGDEQRWTPIRPQDRVLIGKVEAQAWLGLYQSNLLANSPITFGNNLLLY